MRDEKGSQRGLDVVVEVASRIQPGRIRTFGVGMHRASAKRATRNGGIEMEGVRPRKRCVKKGGNDA